jgi:hypothetical protein
MMNGVSGYAQMSQSFQPNRGITDEQSQKLTEFLSDYDTSNLSEEDATEIVSQVKELGINPGAGLANVLNESGIDAKALAEQAGLGKVEGAGGPPGGKGGPGGTGGPPPSGGTGGREEVDDALVSLFSDAMEVYEESDEAESLWEVLEPALQAAGYDTSKSVIDFRA